MDLFALAEENFVITFGITIGIGLLQGAILGRGIRNRFPSFKRHARIVSVIVLILFSINAISNVIKFAVPEKISVSELTMPSTAEEGFTFVINILGLNAGLGTVIITFISISIILLLRFANIHNIARYFMFGISVIVVSVALVSRFTDYVPTEFQILLYAFYQSGITVGIFLVTRRKETNVLSEIR
jgi:hypothetical protein